MLDALALELLIASKAGFCGAIRYHLNDHESGLDDMRHNIDAWWPYVDDSNGQKIEAIVKTVSGCGVKAKEYGHPLADDSAYLEKAQKISALTRDLSEILPELEGLLMAKLKDKISQRVAYHPPCNLQHGQQIRGKVERMLRNVGVDVQLCADSHLCCDSAGTYSVLQPALSHQLRKNKLRNLQVTQPDMIVSANIGCLAHL